MTREEFIQREKSVWGEDYIFALFDSGYEAVELISATGQIKWTWKMQVLTTASESATVGRGSTEGFTPVFLTDRASRG